MKTKTEIPAKTKGAAKSRSRAKRKDSSSKISSTEFTAEDKEKLDHLRMAGKEIRGTPEYERFLHSLCGKYANSSHSLDDYLRDKRKDAERENHV